MVARAPGEMGSPAGDGAWHGEADEVVGIAMANSKMRQAFALRIVSLLGFSKSVAADCGLTAHGRHGARVALARPAATEADFGMGVVDGARVPPPHWAEIGLC